MSSTNRNRRVVVTGIGMISPIGNNRADFGEALLAGRSGITEVESPSRHVAFHGVGGEVKDFDEKSLKKLYFKSKDQKKSIKVMCREVQMGAAAALLALEDSGLDLEAIDHSRLGVDFGANLMFYPPVTLAEACLSCVDEQSGEFDSNRWGADGLKAMEPLWMLKYLPNMPACHIGIFIDARGPNNSITLDEASPGVAMTEALNIIERGTAEMMVVGGTGTRLHTMRTLHSRLWDELGYDAEDISASCKPFDKNRSGQVVAESSGSLLLEEEEHAKARGATIYARLHSGASSCVARADGTTDQAQAVVNTISASLNRAGLSVADLGHINAHGLGTSIGDAEEAKAYRTLLKDANVPITSLKGQLGNSGAGSGFLEIAGSILALREGKIPGTLNCSSPDESLGIEVVAGQARATENKLFASVNFTMIGQASSVVLEVA